jgi:hypothetical protein
MGLAAGHPVNEDGKQWLGVLGLAVSALALIAVAGSYQVVDEARIWKLSAGAAAVLLVPLWAAGFKWYGMEAPARLGPLSFALAVLAWVALSAANGFFDSSEPVVRRLTLLSAPVSVRAKTVKAQIQSWRPGHEREAVMIPAQLARECAPGKCALAVRTKAGRLGAEWVQSVERVR